MNPKMRIETLEYACVLDCGGHDAAFLTAIAPGPSRRDFSNSGTVQSLPPLLGVRGGVRASSLLAKSARL